MDGASHRVQVALLLSHELGMRASEISKLRLREIYTEQGTLRDRVQVSGIRSSRVLPLRSIKLRAVLADHFESAFRDRYIDEYTPLIRSRRGGVDTRIGDGDGVMSRQMPDDAHRSQMIGRMQMQHLLDDLRGGPIGKVLRGCLAVLRPDTPCCLQAVQAVGSSGGVLDTATGYLLRRTANCNRTPRPHKLRPSAVRIDDGHLHRSPWLLDPLDAGRLPCPLARRQDRRWRRIRPVQPHHEIDFVLRCRKPICFLVRTGAVFLDVQR